MISFRSRSGVGAALVAGASRDATGQLGAVSVVEDWAGLCLLQAEWNALYATCDRPSSCASYAWSAAWWQAFGTQQDGAGEQTSLYVVTIRDDAGRLVGVAPMYEERPSSPLRIRRLRIIGFVGHDGIFDMTEEPTVLICPGHEDRVLAGVTEALRPGILRGRWDAVYFRVHGGDSPLKRAFRPLRRHSSVWTDVRSGSDYADLPATWAEYRKALTKSMRDNLGYYPRLLTRDGHDWSLRILRSPDEMPAATARLVDLHHARAESGKGQHHDDHIHGPAQQRFLLGLLERLSATGEAFVAELVVNERVVASQAFVQSGDQLMVYYSGYDEAWYRYSPIFVIDSAVFKEALERGVRRLDFLRNIAPWKTRWLAQPGPKMHRAVLVPRRPDCWLRYGAYTCRQAFQRNVVVRIPILGERFIDWVRELTKSLGKSRERLLRSAPGALPVIEQLSRRVSPLAHGMALHHVLVAQAVLHR